MDERHLLIALNAAQTLTRAALCRLASSAASWRRAEAADVPRLAPRLGVPAASLGRALELVPRAAELAERELERAERAGCRLVTLGEEDYPHRLEDLTLPPPVLTVRGRLDERWTDSGLAIAVVGARRPDAYGREVAECFASRLAAAGIAIVSGFAQGVDEAAHRAAVQAGGVTVAVLGCGLDVDYPRRREGLRRDLAQRGALISEFPLGAEPRPWHFPVRNRVIAALGSATLVVVAKLRSGSLHTAHHALELGRDVYAVPGRIFDELSMGTNALLADGAHVARSPEDLLDSLGIGVQRELFPEPAAEEPPPAPVLRKPPEGAAGRVLEALPPGRPQTAEDVAGRLEVSVDQVLAVLLELELGGWVRREPGPVYVR